MNKIVKLFLSLTILLLSFSYNSYSRVLNDDNAIKSDHQTTPKTITPARLKPQSVLDISKTIKQITYDPTKAEMLNLRTNIMTTIILPEGEVGKKIALGDNQNIITEFTQDPATVTLFPKLAGIDTNITITTDGGVYSFYIRSYGTEDNITPDFVVRLENQHTLKRKKELVQLKKDNPTIREVGSFTDINMKYKIKIRGKKISGKEITPTTVYDDGFRTYMHYKKDLIAKRMPAVFAIVNGIDTQINYRVTKDNIIIVEGLSSEGFTLKSGKGIVCVRPSKSLQKVYKKVM